MDDIELYPIHGIENYYADKKGNIHSTMRGRKYTISPYENFCGDKVVKISLGNGRTKTIKHARALALAFYPLPVGREPIAEVIDKKKPITPENVRWREKKWR